MTEPRTYRTDAGDDYLTRLAAALDREAAEELTVPALSVPLASAREIRTDRRDRRVAA